MFMRDLLFAGFLAAIGAQAQAQAVVEDEAPQPRAVAALPLPLGDMEPTPPSPLAGDAEEGGFGRPATEAEIAAIDIDVMPDGSGLPEGSGTFQQGQALYEEQCASCHGENLEGIKETGAPALIGGRDSLATNKPVKTVESYWPHASTLFDYVHRAMPMTEPGSLSPDQVYALSAYILGRGGILDEDATLTPESFRRIVMPNADGFIPDPRPAGM